MYLCADCGGAADRYDHRDYGSPLAVDPVCVPAEMQCYHPEKIGALLTLARDHLASIERE